jgi:hypothetical protein
MASIDYKEGSYSIAANQSHRFSFWWGTDSNGSKEYFNVSIAPTGASENLLLLEEKREIMYVKDKDGKGPPREVLYLTLRNDNDVPVHFLANHVRISP